MNDIVLKLFTDYIVPGLGTAILSLITVGSGIIIAKLNRKLKNEQIKQAMDQIATITKNVVQNLSQTVVADLKEKSADGKLTKEEMIEIKNKAILLIKVQMQDEVLNLLKKSTIDVDSLISTSIESVIFENNRK